MVANLSEFIWKRTPVVLKTRIFPCEFRVLLAAFQWCNRMLCHSRIFCGCFSAKFQWCLLVFSQCSRTVFTSFFPTHVFCLSGLFCHGFLFLEGDNWSSHACVIVRVLYKSVSKPSNLDFLPRYVNDNIKQGYTLTHICFYEYSTKVHWFLGSFYT